MVFDVERDFGDGDLDGVLDFVQTHLSREKGKLLNFIPIPEDLISNNAFGGPDMKTLYVTAGKTLFKFRTEIPGLPR